MRCEISWTHFARKWESTTTNDDDDDEKKKMFKTRNEETLKSQRAAQLSAVTEPIEIKNRDFVHSLSFRFNQEYSFQL